MKSMNASPQTIFECIVESPFKVLGFLTLTHRSKTTVEIHPQHIQIGNQKIYHGNIVAIHTFQPKRSLITKSNFGVHLDLGETWFFFYARGLKNTPHLSHTLRLIDSVKLFFKSKISN